ncbi:anti-anti-sigma factor [Halopolyspora algeriensis]|uniref:Anti-sigma factor antagonist n=1 Tax=Halopolyspora algeriensis TaxID=1500506 RepID=A0A368VW29_9ACTN|nr:STAS domain-containing protein [Halopolyspora algeriensis]RCW46043.1 anti-anti-sigma factor [Halopolyspora algeriensis]TQM55455.1 anti-anti-sigma factor [Halopolyspora algeriensis]
MILSHSAANSPTQGGDAATTPPQPAPPVSHAFVPPRRAPDHDISRDQQRIDPTLRLAVERPVPGVSVVHMHGEIDLSSVPRLTELIRQRLTAAVLNALVLDLTEVSFVSSHGIELLLHTQHRAEQRGIELSVIAESTCVCRMLELTGLVGRFTCYSSVTEAVAAARA